jgi:hypothetical protein
MKYDQEKQFSFQIVVVVVTKIITRLCVLLRRGIGRVDTDNQKSRFCTLS